MFKSWIVLYFSLWLSVKTLWFESRRAEPICPTATPHSGLHGSAPPHALLPTGAPEARNSREEVTGIGKTTTNVPKSHRRKQMTLRRYCWRITRHVTWGIWTSGLAIDGGVEKFSVSPSPAARSDGRIGQRRWVTVVVCLYSFSVVLLVKYPPHLYREIEARSK